MVISLSLPTISERNSMRYWSFTRTDSRLPYLQPMFRNEVMRSDTGLACCQAIPWGSGLWCTFVQSEAESGASYPWPCHHRTILVDSLAQRLFPSLPILFCKDSASRTQRKLVCFVKAQPIFCKDNHTSWTFAIFAKKNIRFSVFLQISDNSPCLTYISTDKKTLHDISYWESKLSYYLPCLH